LLMGIYKFYSCFKGEERLEEIADCCCYELENWEDIKYQICYSNVIQRDNLLFARRLDKSLVLLAKEKAKEAKSTDNLWTSRSRRMMLELIIEEWISCNRKRPTVKRLMSALSEPEFLDVKLKVERLLEQNYEDFEINRIIEQIS